MANVKLNDAPSRDRDCPTDEQLSSFLDSDHSAHDTVIVDHVGSCDTCQMRLEVLTTDSSKTASSSLELPCYLEGLASKLAETSDTTSVPTPDLPGYEILEVIGRGGMGVVYRARHIRLDREVALKVIASEAHAHPDYRKRLDREGQLLAKLSHPGIVRIFDSGEHRGLPYLALELVTHGSLAGLKSQFRSPENAVRLIEVLARATHIAHQQGIVHRDLKPANILLDLAENDRSISDDHCIEVDGTRLVPKIVDFGLSKVSSNEGATDVSVSLALVGTPQYMSPEQATENTDRIGPATDIHSLGVILYELLTGKRPFDAGGALNTMQRICSHTPDVPSVHNPDVDQALDAIVLKCLEKKTAKRFESAAALANELSRFRAKASLGPGFAKKSKWPRRTLLAGVLIILAACVALLIESQTNRQKRKAVDPMQVVETEDANVTNSGESQIENPAQHMGTDALADSSFNQRRNDQLNITMTERPEDLSLEENLRATDAGKSATPKWESMTQRAIAEWALSRNAEVVLSSHPHFNCFNDPLPNAEVVVSSIEDLRYLTNEEMKLFDYLPELERAGPTFGNYRGYALVSLNHCSKLNWVSLNGSEITDEELTVLNLENTRVLKVAQCDITGASLPMIAAARNLVLLGASPSLIGAPEAAIWFPKMNNIKQLDIFECDDGACIHLSKLPSLTTLNLHHSNGITDACIKFIAKCPKLTRVIFNRVDFGSADLRKLKDLKTINYLGVNHCQLGNMTPQELRKVFPNCHVTGNLTPMK